MVKSTPKQTTKSISKTEQVPNTKLPSSKISTVVLKSAAYDLTCQIRACKIQLEEINKELLKRNALIINVEVTPDV